SEAARTVVNDLQLRFSPRVRRAARKARILLAANSTIQNDLRRALGVEAQRLLEAGLKTVAPAPPPQSSTGPLRLLCSGDLSPWKALPLLLEALALLPADLDYEVRILGRGPLRASWERLAARLGVAHRLRWLGYLPHADALRQYTEADLFVFTSLRDTTG